jgi:hypothetical protein
VLDVVEIKITTVMFVIFVMDSIHVFIDVLFMSSPSLGVTFGINEAL